MSGPEQPDFVAIARAGWGEALPDWVLRLAEECTATSQAATARRIGRSGSLVSSVLRGKYEGSLPAVEELVRGVLMKAVVPCPALGELPAHECVAWRQKARAFSGHNALRVRMFRACTRCPRNRPAGTGGTDA